MRILIIHNRYQQRGGEDAVFAAEVKLLRDHGHTVTCLEADNDRIDNLATTVMTAIESVYSLSARWRLKALLERTAPEIVHVHNFFPSLSPSIFHACSDAGVPVVLTVHNYRIVCAGATLFRDGHPCEDCIDAQSFLPAVRHACYRDSRTGSAVVGIGMSLHARLGTWANNVSGYIALSEFSAAKLAQFRIPPEKIFVKPNFVEDLGAGSGDGGYALFAGRLTVEKGVRTLINADSTGQLPMDILVAGDGPLRGELEHAAAQPGSRLIIKGMLNRETTAELMRRAALLVIPSLWYEGGAPMVALEAIGAGLPIIGADVGNIGASIRHLETGLKYSPGSANALIQALRNCMDNPKLLATMRKETRNEYHRKYTPEISYARLMEIYGTILSKGTAK